MNFQVTETETKVAEFFNSIKGSEMEIIYIGTDINPEGWEHDSWKVRIKTENNTSFVDFDYNTGIGHRIEKKERQYTFNRKTLLEVKKLKSLYPNLHHNNNVLFNVRGKGDQIKAVMPTQASVLYCLLSDMSCGEESFNDFCDNLGYDSDSMKAFNIYKSCMDSCEKMRKLFTHKQLETFQKLLEDF